MRPASRINLILGISREWQCAVVNHPLAFADFLCAGPACKVKVSRRLRHPRPNQTRRRALFKTHRN